MGLLSPGGFLVGSGNYLGPDLEGDELRKSWRCVGTPASYLLGGTSALVCEYKQVCGVIASGRLIFQNSLLDRASSVL